MMCAFVRVDVTATTVLDESYFVSHISSAVLSFWSCVESEQNPCPRLILRMQLRTIFLKYENPSEGAYFAELVNEVYAKNDALGHNVLLGADYQRCDM
jgi:hypothetical protein